MNLASYIDHTLLRPDAQPEQIEQLCQEAADNQFASVCVPPCYVRLAVETLRDTGVPVCTVIGFPLGYGLAKVKFFEGHQALSEGATELDMVINIGALKAGRVEEVEEEIGELAELCHLRGALLKVIIETALLTEDEIVLACEICAEAGADFVKTSTGFAGRGASISDIELMRQSLPTHIRIKASGGIRTRETALALIAAGADRIGSSNSLVLLEDNSHETLAS
ncbi:deoxyribose-phosphate aldolase [Hymenobacter taeanensis]|uniref:Deoxyribose-phosphate aldolase n=1 Tax=Hymenobacter taeanensis TaxID=2735321 RepID=A0A6M6BDR6_9BACT|nr:MULTISPECIES: deoxyribose-phosphate aldolase [Hymenobacter]QJX46100.1 deoxyribose-phosphate aldolase [Hymenobacter taeanensis]UOQ79956.1 deoxyribose-phosphate aldolase [Hymenobacter sp. 5414T-23]